MHRWEEGNKHVGGAFKWGSAKTAVTGILVETGSLGWESHLFGEASTQTFLKD